MAIDNKMKTKWSSSSSTLVDNMNPSDSASGITSYDPYPESSLVSTNNKTTTNTSIRLHDNRRHSDDSSGHGDHLTNTQDDSINLEELISNVDHHHHHHSQQMMLMHSTIQHDQSLINLNRSSSKDDDWPLSTPSPLLLQTDTEPTPPSPDPVFITTQTPLSADDSISKWTPQIDLSSTSFLSPSSSSSSSSGTHLTTIATLANSLSAAFLPMQQQRPKVTNQTMLLKSQQEQSSIVEYIDPNVSSGVSSLLNISVGTDSMTDGDYYDTWSNQDYQFLINLSIGGILLTTFVLLLFLLWLCCSKNDRDQYSIRKVTTGHNSHDIHQQNRNSIHSSGDGSSGCGLDSIDVVINNGGKWQSQRRSNCSLYISNPNSEHGQPSDVACSIMFHNQMASEHHAASHIQQLGGDVECSSTSVGVHKLSYDGIFDNNKYTTVLAQHHLDNKFNAGQHDKFRSQMARNLATYCEQQQKIIDNGTGTNGDHLIAMKNKQQPEDWTNTIYDYYDYSNTSKSLTLPWPISNTNNSSTTPTNMNVNNSSPFDGQVNFTKKRRNRMHNDSAAAIALNRSGLVLLPGQQQSNNSQIIRSSPNALVSYLKETTNQNSELDFDSGAVLDKRHQTSPESSSGDSLIALNDTQQPIVVYNERTAL